MNSFTIDTVISISNLTAPGGLDSILRATHNIPADADLNIKLPWEVTMIPIQITVTKEVH